MRRIGVVSGDVRPVGPFSHAVVANGFVFTSGQLPAISNLSDQPDAFDDKVRQTLANLEATLREAGSSLQNVVKVNTYLTDPGQLEPYNAVYSEFFGSDLPARTPCASIFSASPWRSSASPSSPKT